MSDLRDEYRSMYFCRSHDWKPEAVNAVLRDLRQRCFEFLDRAGKTRESGHIDFTVEARYEGQVWEIEIPVRVDRFSTRRDIDALVEDFHAHHSEVFAVRDDHSAVEFVCWTAAVSAGLREKQLGRLSIAGRKLAGKSVRNAYFRDHGLVETPIVSMESLEQGVVASGPAIVETPFTTIVIDPRASYWLEESGSLLIKP